MRSTELILSLAALATVAGVAVRVIVRDRPILHLIAAAVHGLAVAMSLVRDDYRRAREDYLAWIGQSHDR